MPQLNLADVAPELRSTFDAVNGFAEKAVYQPLAPVPLTPSGGATAVRFRDLSAILLPAAGTPVATTCFQVPPDFVTGSLGMAIDLSGDLGSAVTISLGYGLTAVAVGASLAQNTTGVESITGPATANLLLRYSVATLITVPGSAELVEMKLFRVNPDAYAAGNVYICGVRPLWYPRKQ